MKRIGLSCLLLVLVVEGSALAEPSRGPYRSHPPLRVTPAPSQRPAGNGPSYYVDAGQGDDQAYRFPRPMLHSGDLDFSFAGLKTAVLTQVKRLAHARPEGPATSHLADPLTDQQKADVAASAQAAIVEVLVKKSMAAVKASGLRRLVVAGGVGANTLLRQQLNQACARAGVRVHYPELHLCTDNGAMIALAAGLRAQAGLLKTDGTGAYRFDVRPRWPLSELAPSTP